MSRNYQKKKKKGKEKSEEDYMVDMIPKEGSEGKSGFVSHIKHTAEATNMDLFHS